MLIVLPSWLVFISCSESALFVVVGGVGHSGRRPRAGDRRTRPPNFWVDTYHPHDHKKVTTSMDGRIHVFDVRRVGTNERSLGVDGPRLVLSGHHRGKANMVNPVLLGNGLLATGAYRHIIANSYILGRAVDT
jgi:hypothetical protein